MDRRQFLTKVKNKPPGYSKRFIASGLNPYAGSWTINEVSHLLKRTMFGAKKTDIDYFLGLSPNDAVNELLNNIPVPAPPVRDYGLIRDDEDDMPLMFRLLSVFKSLIQVCPCATPKSS